MGTRILTADKSSAINSNKGYTMIDAWIDAIVRLLEKIITPISRKLDTLSALMAGIMSIPIFFDVLARLIFGKSIPGIIELEEFMMVLIVFLALAFTQIQKEHVDINLVFSRFPKWVQNLIETFNYSICLIVFSLMSWQTVIQVIKKFGEVSFSLGIPISIFLGVAAFGVILLTIVLLADLLRSISVVIKEGKWLGLMVAFSLAALLLASPFLIKMLPGRFGGLSLGMIGMVLLFILLLLKMPIGYAMAVTGFLGMLIISKKVAAPLSILGIAPYHSTASFIMAVVPLFILMGELAFYSGISKDLFDAANKWLGRLPGGLSMASVAGCAGFAAVCGDSMSTAVTMGAVSLPEMEKKKYSPSLATGSLAAGGTLGILIPPSVGFIFYAIITEESVGKLFIAGILPGLLLATLFMLSIFLMALYKPQMAPRGDRTSFEEKLISLKGVIPMLLLFFLILGGILGGIFSPTEGGGIGAVGAFLYALARRRISKENLMAALKETAKLTTKLLFILIGVGILGYFLAATRLPFILSDVVTGLPFGRHVILGAVLLLFIVLGCLMNVIPMILLTLPAIFPSIIALGFDPIWFGVVTVIVMEMGQITPPIGVNVFALSSVATEVPLETIFKGVLPFFVCMVLCVIILIIFPQIATFLPNLLF
ncbi:MAG: TRAP transporter large permease subunit [Deltaproteobacteria bacterium]|nr:TRAP transporter large permease subunit [Deltaproteobacteria bacterium]MBW2051296.1 TRAP transporter large permease subunit [Deltaproteobacteria bacterium]MBW2141341.1 TRAP transporter large permease subunit [Deltaproteobacteria bacterium]MBW2323783.1 TRAP transporter large permease subunit [Deltaproteobacteria bacterium]